MKNFILLFITVFCIAVPELGAQRCLPGQRELLLNAGTVNGFNTNFQSKDFDFHAGIALSRYTKSFNRWQFGVDYLEKGFTYKWKSIPQVQFTADAGYFLNFLTDVRKTFFVSVGASAVGGYETVNWGKKVLFDGATITDKDGFLYGGALTIEAEAYLTNRFALLVNVKERFLTGSSVGKPNTLFGIGIKFTVN